MSPQRIRAIAVAAVVVGLVAARPAAADNLPREVKKAFGGDILFSTDALPAPDPADPKATISQYRKQRVKAVAKRDVDGTPTWTFHFMAFMKKKPHSKQVSLDFYTVGKEKLFVAQERLAGIDPNLTLLASEVTLTEDDGLTPGRTYEVKLTTSVRGRQVVLATGRLTTK